VAQTRNQQTRRQEIPESTEPDGSYVDLTPALGGGVNFIAYAAPGNPAAHWEMTHSEALTLAARTLGLLGYRELHIRDDYTVSDAS
jgi:hypothetical protein